MIVRNTPAVLLLLAFGVVTVRGFGPVQIPTTTTQTMTSTTLLHGQVSDSDVVDSSARRDLFRSGAVGALATASSLLLPGTSPALAATPAGANDGNLPDLPPDAVRSYLQYRIPLQISADFYVWELQDKLRSFDNWGEVGQLFTTNNSRGGQGQPNKIERDFTNPMRILGLSMPPDVADELRDAQFAFEKAMFGLTKTTAGVKRDLPVELDERLLVDAAKGWDNGRLAINQFFTAVNEATGLNELKLIPPSGPNQNKEYGRSQLKYLDLAKKTKLCQNRGGPALSQAWGQLMVSGYLQDSCGIPDLDRYFYQ